MTRHEGDCTCLRCFVIVPKRDRKYEAARFKMDIKKLVESLRLKKKPAVVEEEDDSTRLPISDSN